MVVIKVILVASLDPLLPLRSATSVPGRNNYEPGQVTNEFLTLQSSEQCTRNTGR